MESEYPDAFRCPISLELMTDPVILTSGHTFDRASIQRWLDAGNLTCPVTKLPLQPRPPLIPNHALRGLISTFAPLRPPKLQPHPQPSPSNPKTVAAALLSAPTDPAALSAALRLAKRDAAFRRLLADAGAAPLLLRHDLHDLSLSLLLHLSLDGDDARVGLVADGALDRLSDTLRRRGPPAALAATLLTSLAVVEVNKCTIGAHPSIIPALAALLREGKPRERREAATALYELCKFPENRKRAVRSGAVPWLIQLARSGSERSVEVLTLLAKSREGRDQMGALIGFTSILAEVLRDGSSRAVEHALSALDLVCSNDDAMASEARREGVLQICLGLIGDSNEKIAKNAIGLARTLQKSEFVSLI